MVDRCVRKDSSSCDPSHITRDGRSRVMWLGSRGVRPYAPFNHMVFFLCHGFIKFIYINKIVMKTRLNVCILRATMWTTLCPNHRVWILPVGLDFASGSGYENPMGQTPCCIMWSTHNNGINSYILAITPLYNSNFLDPCPLQITMHFV